MAWRALLLAVLLGSCAPRPRLRGPHQGLPAYRQALEQLTRSGCVFTNVDREITVFATRLTDDFRRLLRTEYRRVFGFPLEQGRGSLERLLQATRGQLAFFLYADASEFSWGEMEGSDSVWKVSLLVAGREPRPGQVRHVESPAPTVRAFFPFIGEFGRSYLVSFPPAPGDGGDVPTTEAVTLLLASAFGKLQLEWPGPR
ncbi:MAG: hypothetical protein DRI34_08125 [Deltaproteobacteria bacterium]|nr:MAG: hypothetical protein DRI34_08125 [Deltaproteobacteria bacterium]